MGVIASPAGFSDPRVHVLVGDISDPAVVAQAITPDTQSIFHLAAIVSGQAAVEFALGMKINFDATREILERAKALGTQPRVSFTSSVAVFAGELGLEELRVGKE